MSADPLPTKLIAGKYRLGDVLGEGGMGIIFKATHADLGHRVAVKMLRTDVPTVPNAAERFLREARASVQLQSRHVARVTDVGTSEDGVPFMVIEYLQGRDLADVIEERVRIPYSQAATWMLQVCDAVAEAHSLGIVHRDLKPSNLFLARGRGGEDTIKVLDFGISKALFGEDGALSDSNLTETQTIVGTPLYASPEQLRSSKSVDARTDIWSLGVILFELVTGRLPFQAETVSGLIANIAADPAKRASEFVSDIPQELEEVIDRALTKDREVRYATVADFATALTPFAEPGFESLVDRIQRVSGIPRVPQSAIATMVDEGGAPSTGRGIARTVSSRASRKSLTLVAMALGGAVLIGGAVLASQQMQSDEAAEEPSKAAENSAPASSPPAVIDVDSEPKVEPVMPTEAEEPKRANEPGVPQLRLKIAAEPANARLVLDGAELVSNPFDAQLPADGSMHRLEVRAYGYLGQARTLVFDKDLELQITLRRKKPGSGSKPSPEPEPEAAPKPAPKPSPSGPDIYEDNPYW